MYFVMSRLDARRFCQLDFIANFGVAPTVKTDMSNLIQSGGGQSSTYKFLATLEPLVLLKIHKYFFWADKKLHAVTYIDDKDQISEDLLFDFKDEDEQLALKKSE